MEREYYGFSTEVKDDFTATDLVLHLAKGFPLLVPYPFLISLAPLPSLFTYDNDKNNTPCVKFGAFAHWAVICGFAIPVEPTEEIPPLLESYEGTNIYFSKEREFSSELLKYILDRDDNLYLISGQSRSKYKHLWAFKNLKDSNRNLKAASELRLTTSQYKIPEDLKDLRGKAVLVKWE